MTIFFNTFLICFLYYIIGQSYINLKNNFSNCCLLIINGAIILSFVALFLNFFLKLDLFENTIIFTLAIIYAFYKNSFNKIINIKNLKSLILISLFATILIILSDSNRPDSGLYHFPFIKLLNDEKIIVGLTNINSRFGTISIIQYLQAISNNFLTKNNGMLLPLSIIPSAIYLYFYSEINLQLKKQSVNNKIYLLFLFFSFIFFSFKMNRYGEYGNDYIPHFLVFFLLSLILKYKNKIKISNVYFYSTFIFLNKIIFLPIFLFAIIILKFNFKKKNIFNKKIFFVTFVLLLWILKNILHSGCLFWPIEKSCIQDLSWFNKDINSTQHVSKLSAANEAWSKAWPDQKTKVETFDEYINGYKWINVWLSKHGKKIFKILLIYVSITIIISFFLKKNSNAILNKNISNSSKNELITYISIFALSSVIWFLKFPVYRFGISNLILSLILLLILFNNRIDFNKKNIKLVKYISILCITIFISKNMLKLQNYNVNYKNHPWPKYYSFDKKNEEIDLFKVKLFDKFSHYRANGLCMYSKSPCTHEKVSKLLNIKKKYSYKIYYF